MADNIVIETDRPKVRNMIRRAFAASAVDARNVASQKAPKRTTRLSKSGRVAQEGDLKAKVVFDTEYARAQEKGAYITAKRAKQLRFPIGGAWRSPKAVRLPARPYLRPAGALWKKSLFLGRLRQELGR